MIVISDTTPLHYLVLVGQAELLPQLYGHVIIAQAVFEELQRPRAPKAVLTWITHRPPWLEVRRASHAPDPSLQNLGAGEGEAITLAQELRADLLLIDDEEGRQEAESRKLAVIGTLGVLDKAAERGLIDLLSTLARLQQTNFYVSADVMRSFLDQDAERKKRRQHLKPDT